MEKKPPLLILTGPTAVGKTALSIALAREVQGEIISADSMQVYRYMDIGSAKNRKEERSSSSLVRFYRKGNFIMKTFALQKRNTIIFPMERRSWYVRILHFSDFVMYV